MNGTANGLGTAEGRLRMARDSRSWHYAEVVRSGVRREIEDGYKGGTLPLDIYALIEARLPPEWAGPDRWDAALAGVRSEVREQTEGDPLAVALAAMAADRLACCSGHALRGVALADLRAELGGMYERAHPKPRHGHMSAQVLEVKSAAAGDTATVYACVFGNIDRQSDMIAPGAVKNIDEFIRSGWVDVNHENREPIGDIVAARQDDRGLLTTVRFFDTPRAQAYKTIVRSRLAAKKDAAASIGYQAVDSHMDRKGSDVVRVLTGINVFEVSFVNLPANPAAGFVSI